MKINSRDIQQFFLRNGYLLISSAWLITFSFLVNNYWWYISSPANVQKSLEKNIQQRETHFQKLVSDKELMHELLNRDYDAKTLKEFTGNNKDFYLSFYNGDWETFWSTNQIAIDSSVYNLPEGVHFKKLKSGYYEIIRKDFDADSYMLGFIPVKEQYYFSNPYLPDRYYKLPRISNQYKIELSGDGMPIRSISGKILFYIQNPSASSSHSPPWLSGILLSLAVVCIMIFFNQLALFIGRRTKKWWGFLFLCAVFLFFR